MHHKKHLSVLLSAILVFSPGVASPQLDPGLMPVKILEILDFRQHAPHLRRNQTAGRARRREKGHIAAQGHTQGRNDTRQSGTQFFGRHRLAETAHRLRKSLGKGPGVEVARALTANAANRGG